MKILVLSLLFLSGCTNYPKSERFEIIRVDVNSTIQVDKKMNIICYHIKTGTSCLKMDNLPIDQQEEIRKLTGEVK